MSTQKVNMLVLLPLVVLAGGCSISDILDNKESDQQEVNASVNIKETIQVSISCNKDTIQDYLDKGWQIKDSSTSEVACSWKTKKASKNCNIESDKGCKITIPDLIGEEIRYVLERDKKQSN